MVNPVRQLGTVTIYPVVAGVAEPGICEVGAPDEDVLVVAGNPVAEQHRRAGLILNQSGEVVEDVGLGGKVGLLVIPQPPEVLHCQGGELFAHIAAVDFRHLQRPVAQPRHRVGAGQPQLRERGDLHLDLPVGARPHIGNEVGLQMPAPQQRPVDAGVAQDDAFALRGQRRRVGQAGFADELPVILRLKQPLVLLDGVQRHIAGVIAQGEAMLVSELGIHRRPGQSCPVAIPGIDGAGPPGVGCGVPVQRRQLHRRQSRLRRWREARRRQRRGRRTWRRARRGPGYGRKRGARRGRGARRLGRITRGGRVGRGTEWRKRGARRRRRVRRWSRIRRGGGVGRGGRPGRS